MKKTTHRVFSIGYSQKLIFTFFREVPDEAGDE